MADLNPQQEARNIHTEMAALFANSREATRQMVEASRNMVRSFESAMLRVEKSLGGVSSELRDASNQISSLGQSIIFSNRHAKELNTQIQNVGKNFQFLRTILTSIITSKTIDLFGKKTDFFEKSIEDFTNKSSSSFLKFFQKVSLFPKAMIDTLSDALSQETTIRGKMEKFMNLISPFEMMNNMTKRGGKEIFKEGMKQMINPVIGFFDNIVKHIIDATSSYKPKDLTKKPIFYIFDSLIDKIMSITSSSYKPEHIKREGALSKLSEGLIKILGSSLNNIILHTGKNVVSFTQGSQLGKWLAGSKTIPPPIPITAAGGAGGMAGGIGRFMGGVGAGGFGGGLAALGIGPLAATGIGAVILAVILLMKKLFDLFNQFDSMAANFRMNMGFLAKYSYQITQQGAMTFREWAKFGANLNDALESFQAIADTIGTAQATSGMVSQMILFNKQLGISYDTSSQFLLSMAEIGRTTMDASNDMLNAIGRLSQEKMVNLTTAMSDVNETMKSSFSLMRQTPMALIKAAVAARAMGTDLKSTARTAESVLDFTSSIGKEMEASVLLGKSINLQRLRELSYVGDLAGAQEEILRIIQDSNYEQLDFFQKRALASALNKEPEQLERMLVARRQQLALGKSIGQIQKEEYDQQLKMRANQSTMTQLANVWASVWVDLAPTMLQIAEIVRQLIPALNFMVNIMKTMMPFVLGIASILPGGNEIKLAYEASKAVNPEINIEKPKPEFDMAAVSATMARTSVASVDMSTLEDKLDEHTDAIKALHNDLKAGKLVAQASISMDSQRVDSAMARALAFKGTLQPQPGLA